MNKNDVCAVYIDGGARGNPGPAAAGWVIKDSHGALISRQGRFLGTTTNNIAEYEALLHALDDAVNRGIQTVTIYSDSQLMVRQLTGVYKIKNPGIRKCLERYIVLQHAISILSITHIPREQNTEADELVNDTLDLHTQ
ncbi:MAG: reverse transcriptase-like protein [Elusimicrobia bacterium]|nr:reverse transcriptase-like protein [Elusimicrobiota bacterium]MBD3411596.1 reverse transcriptase-like protein [Elusimicrobiota bacterium]